MAYLQQIRYCFRHRKQYSKYKLFEYFETSLNILQRFKGAFICNRDEISSRDETGPGMKKFLFTSEFHPGMKRVEFHPGMKCGLQENLTLSMKKYSRIYHFSLIC